MVGKGVGIRLIVVEDLSPGIHPGNADVPVPNLGLGPVQAEFLGLPQKLRRAAQVPAHLLAEQVVEYHRHRRHRQCHSHQSDEPQTQVDFLLHTVPSGALRST